MIVAVLSILALSATAPAMDGGWSTLALERAAAQRADAAQRRDKVDKAASAGRGRDAQRAEQARAERRDKVQKAASAGRHTTSRAGVVQLKDDRAKKKDKANKSAEPARQADAARKDDVRRIIEASKRKKK